MQKERRPLGPTKELFLSAFDRSSKSSSNDRGIRERLQLLSSRIINYSRKIDGRIQ